MFDVKRTPLYDVHLSLGAKMYVARATGYTLPEHYSSPLQEHRAVRERVGICDLSLMAKIDVKGSQAFDLVQMMTVNDAGKLTDGQCMYSTMCNEHGNILDDVTVWRFTDQHYRVVTSALMRHKTLATIQSRLYHEKMTASITDVSSGIGMITVQGPNSLKTLSSISDFDLKSLGLFRFVQANLGGVPAHVARVGFTGELGFECYFSAEDTVRGWMTIQEAGKELGLEPYGFVALESLRLEKGYIFFGFDATEKNNPFECGLDRWIKFDKGEFIGRRALLAIKEKEPSQKLVGLEVSDNEVVPIKSAVLANGRNIGETIESFLGPTIGKSLAWTYMKTQDGDYGSKVSIRSGSREVSATVVNIRYYDPKNVRLKASA
jgi:aminomethyltransferase